jgi:hypothetical protein
MKFIIALVLLSGCASGLSDPSIVYSRLNIDTPSIEQFPHCRGYGCAKIDMVGLDDSEKAELRSLFQDNFNANDEHQNIQTAIAYLENIIGAKTGTGEDVAGTYVRLGNYQQDCIDESTNTTTYLMILDQMALLKFHDVNALSSRPPILSGRLGPHRTAVIVEKETGIKYAVDSWFHDNGVKPEIVEMDTWFWGWHPTDK